MATIGLGVCGHSLFSSSLCLKSFELTRSSHGVLVLLSTAGPTLWVTSAPVPILFSTLVLALPAEQGALKSTLSSLPLPL